jgi:hypothetical protein
MNKLLILLYALYVVSYMLGCAYNGDVLLYSPQGDANAIEKSVDGTADLDLPLLP